MAGIEKKALLLIPILLIPLVGAIDMDITLEEKLDHSAKDIQYKENFSHIFEINASVRNRGSFECRYRLRADINETKSSENYKAYSRAVSLWPSQFERISLYASPKNYTGPVEGNLYIEYCGKEELVQNFTSESTETTIVEEKLSLNETNVEEREAEADLEVNNTLLVPRDTPSYWKVGHAEASKFNTTLDYEMPFTNYDRNITYTAFNKTTLEPLGTVKADLQVAEEEKTLIQKLGERKYQVGLAASAVLNLILTVLLLRGKSSKLKF